MSTVEAPVRNKRWTVEDYFALDTDSERYELLEGELVLSPSPSFRHQYVANELNYVLQTWARRRRVGEVYMGPLDIVLSPEDVVQPDIVFYRSGRLAGVGKGPVRTLPDLAVECISPFRPAFDRVHKKALYERSGIPHYWIVDPDAATLEAYRLGPAGYELADELSGDDVFEPELFPGLRFRLSRLWPSW